MLLQLLLGLRRETHRHIAGGRGSGKAGAGLRLALGERQIRLDVHHRGAVDQIEAAQLQHHVAVFIRTPFSSMRDIPSGLGRKVERVANTPMRALPPKRGGRTVGRQPPSVV